VQSMQQEMRIAMRSQVCLNGSVLLFRQLIYLQLVPQEVRGSVRAVCRAVRVVVPARRTLFASVWSAVHAPSVR
jgi:hypothetical protein